HGAAAPPLPEPTRGGLRPDEPPRIGWKRARRDHVQSSHGADRAVPAERGGGGHREQNSGKSRREISTLENDFADPGSPLETEVVREHRLPEIEIDERDVASRGGRR